MGMPLNRRQFLQLGGGLSLALAVNRPSRGENAPISDARVEMRAFTPEGQPLERKPLNQLYFLTLEDEPIANPERSVSAGKLLSRIPSGPFAITVKLPVTDFGEVFLYADNRGKGYSRGDFPLNLNLAFAECRLYRVEKAIELWQSQGFSFSPAIRKRLSRARQYVQQAKETTDLPQMVRFCDQSLGESLYAGEEAVFSQAKQRIDRQSSRPEFLFGGNFFGFPQQGEKYEKLWQDIFNFATLPFYWRSFDDNRANVDRAIAWLQARKIPPKAHPLVWFHEIGFPEDFRNKTFPEIKAIVARRVREMTADYRGKIAYFDVINEPNGIAWANELNFSLEQFIELTAIATEESRRGNPKVFRIVNNCCLWGENVAYHKPPQHSPFEYLSTCLQAGIDFEAIGLQLYYPDRDMFEIDRLLERFSSLGKPIHITELGVSSSMEIDEVSYLREPQGRWHQPWSEEVQADWVEQFYTLCYSKSYIQAISWWDLTDNGNFWPNGGLVRRDMTPKLAYTRLQNLIQQWRGKV
jgi:endo-1,4-beta-xylanase